MLTVVWVFNKQGVSVKKLILIPLLFLFGCFNLGDNFIYVINESRSSEFIVDSIIDANVTSATSEDATFTVEVDVKAVIGPVRHKSITRTISRDVFSTETITELRLGRVIETPEYWVAHAGYKDNCDLIKIDHIPNDDDVENLVLTATVCFGKDTTVPFIDATFTNGGIDVEIGYDFVEQN